LRTDSFSWNKTSTSRLRGILFHYPSYFFKTNPTICYDGCIIKIGEIIFRKLLSSSVLKKLRRKRRVHMSERFFLYDETVETKTRFVSFMGEHQRFDLAIIQSDRYFGKHLVLDIQSNRFAIIGADDLKEPGYLEFAYKLNEEDASELRDFLDQLV
jgi:hypothetical protein